MPPPANADQPARASKAIPHVNASAAIQASCHRSIRSDSRAAIASTFLLTARKLFSALDGQQKCHLVDRVFGNVWHSRKLREFQPKNAARPEKAAHYTHRFAVLQESQGADRG
jgi:hypothetical protein